MDKEIWKVWKKTSRSLWEVSDQGNVKRNDVPYECGLNNGYKAFGNNYKVHRAVADLFIPNSNNYNEVDHINGDKLDNRAINLQWCTHKQNLNNPNYKKRMSESIIKSQSEETRRKRSESLKIYWTNKKNHNIIKHF